MPRRQTSLSHLPLSERLAILNELETAADSTRLNVTLFGLFLGSAGAPLDGSTVYRRVREGVLPPPDASLGAKATGWTLGLARQARNAMVDRSSGSSSWAAQRAAVGKALNLASVKSLRERQGKRRADRTESAKPVADH
jgi:hypothetical protein